MMDIHSLSNHIYFNPQRSDPLETRSQGSNSCSLRTIGKKRGKLDLVKCERCRQDRKKCIPEQRVWPDKCDRCISRGFPCSDGKRAHRKTKHNMSSSIYQGKSTAIEGTHQLQLENGLADWLFKLSYQKIISMAVQQLQTLKQETTDLFSDEWTDEELFDKCLQDTAAEDLCNLQNQLGKLLLNPSVKNGPSLLFSSEATCLALLEHNQASLPYEEDCLLCNPALDQALLESLQHRGDIGSEFLARQRRLYTHFKDWNHWMLDPPDTLNGEEHRLQELMRQVQEKASSSFNPPIVELPGLCHPPSVSYMMFLREIGQTDCLRRTPLLQWLDNVPCPLPQADTRFLQQFLHQQNVDEQDVLGRTLLHVACQVGWQKGVEMLLQEGANPSTTTIYGNPPLHYAAARGSSKTCEMLIAYSNPKHLADSVDCQGHYALYYAVGSKDQATVDILLENSLHDTPVINNAVKSISPLIKAIAQDKFELVDKLMQYRVGTGSYFHDQMALTQVRHIKECSKQPDKWQLLENTLLYGDLYKT